MKISIVLSSPFAKEIMRKDHVYAPGPLADLLIEGLQNRGHDVTLFAPFKSRFSVPSISEPIHFLEAQLSKYKMSVDEFAKEKSTVFWRIYDLIQSQLANVAFQESEKKKSDILHFYCQYSFVPYYLARYSSIPTLFTLHDPVPAADPTKWNRPHLFFPKANYVTVSKDQQKSNRSLNYVAAIHNCVDLKLFSFSAKKEGYLGWIGRPVEEKGPDIAIRVAQAAGRKMKMAAAKPLKSEEPFWNGKIVPAMKENNVDFLGHIGGKKRTDFFKKASGVLFPVAAREAFGLVMIEAMACGTPVIAFDKSAVREIIVHGKTGFIVKNEREMVAAVKKLHTINPADCRAHVEKNFSADAMVEKYEALYKKLAKKR